VKRELWASPLPRHLVEEGLGPTSYATETSNGHGYLAFSVVEGLVDRPRLQWTGEKTKEDERLIL